MRLSFIRRWLTDRKANTAIIFTLSLPVLIGGGGETRTLTLQVPTYVAERNRLAAGEQVALSLLASAIHIMPAAQPRQRKP